MPSSGIPLHRSNIRTRYSHFQFFQYFELYFRTPESPMRSWSFISFSSSSRFPTSDSPRLKSSTATPAPTAAPAVLDLKVFMIVFLSSVAVSLVPVEALEPKTMLCSLLRPISLISDCETR